MREFPDSFFSTNITAVRLRENSKTSYCKPKLETTFITIIIFLHGLCRLTCSGIDALPSFPGASTISSFSRFVVEGVFRQSGVVHSFKMVDPVLFVFESHVLYSPCRLTYFTPQQISRNSSRVQGLYGIKLS